MQLTEHFDTAEFKCHDGTPVPHHAYNDLRRLCRAYLEPLRTRFGPVTIISGFRTASHNRAVGGAPASFHMYRQDRPAAAADLRCRRGAPIDWYRFLDAKGIGGLGLYSGHVHADNRAGRARWSG